MVTMAEPNGRKVFMCFPGASSAARQPCSRPTLQKPLHVHAFLFQRECVGMPPLEFSSNHTFLLINWLTLFSPPLGPSLFPYPLSVIFVNAIYACLLLPSHLKSLSTEPKKREWDGVNRASCRCLLKCCPAGQPTSKHPHPVSSPSPAFVWRSHLSKPSHAAASGPLSPHSHLADQRLPAELNQKSRDRPSIAPKSKRPWVCLCHYQERSYGTSLQGAHQCAIRPCCLFCCLFMRKTAEEKDYAESNK